MLFCFESVCFRTWPVRIGWRRIVSIDPMWRSHFSCSVTLICICSEDITAAPSVDISAWRLVQSRCSTLQGLPALFTNVYMVADIIFKGKNSSQTWATASKEVSTTIYPSPLGFERLSTDYAKFLTWTLGVATPSWVGKPHHHHHHHTDFHMELLHT